MAKKASTLAVSDLVSIPVEIQPSGKQAPTLESVMVGTFRVDQYRAQLNATGESLAQIMLTIAKTYANPEAFEKQCKAVEKSFKALSPADFKAKYRFEPVVGARGRITIPRAWSQYKSNILTGWQEFGLNPEEFETEGKFRTALNDARKAADKPREAGAELPQGFAEKLSIVAKWYADKPELRATLDEALDHLISDLEVTILEAVVVDLDVPEDSKQA